MIFGMINREVPGELPAVARACRDLTISWSRYGYRGPFIVRDTIEEILDEASEEGHDYCVVQSAGHIISETWRPFETEDVDFLSFIKRWTATHDFFVAGSIVQERSGWYGLDPRCILIDLRKYESLGRPRFGKPSPGRIGLPAAGSRYDGGFLVALEPVDGEECCNPATEGWNFLAAGLRRGFLPSGSGVNFRQERLTSHRPGTPNRPHSRGSWGEALTIFPMHPRRLT